MMMLPFVIPSAVEESLTLADNNSQRSFDLAQDDK